MCIRDSVYTDLAFLEPVRTTCKTCQGRRFGEEVLAYTCLLYTSRCV